MPQFLPKQQLDIAGVPQSRVEDLGSDLMGLFGAVGKGLDTYNKIGATAAKLQASEDSREYIEQIAVLRGSLKYAEDKPEVYAEVKGRIDELSSEFVAKSDKFKNHKEAYDTYSNYALDIASSTKASFEPEFQSGFISASKKQKARDIEYKSSVAGVTSPSKELLSVSKEYGKTLGEDFEDSEKQVAMPHLSAIDESIKGKTPQEILDVIATNGTFDKEKAIAYLNSMSGSLVKYEYDKKAKKVVLKGDYESTAIREMYLDRYKLLENYIPKAKDAENVDIKILTNNSAQIPTKFGTPEKNLETAKKKLAEVEKYEKSNGYKIQSLSEKSSFADKKLDAYNYTRISEALLKQIQAGKNIYAATYNPVETYNLNGDIEFRDKPNETGNGLHYATVSQQDADDFISENKKALSMKMANGEEFDFNFAQGIMVSDKGAFDYFKDTLDNSSVSLSQIPSIENAESRMKTLFAFADKAYGVGSFDADIYSDTAGVMKTVIDSAKKRAEANPKDSGKILETALQDVTKYYKAIAPARVVAKEVDARYIESIKDKADIDGLFNNPDELNKETVVAARMSLKTMNNPNPTPDQVAQFISDNGVNTRRWFAREHGLNETILLAPTNSQGQRIVKDVVVDGILWQLRKDGKEPKNFTVENDTMEGYNNRIIVRYKDTGQVVYTLNGDFFDKYSSYVVAKKKESQKTNNLAGKKVTKGSSIDIMQTGIRELFGIED